MNIRVISGFEGKCYFEKPFLETVGKWCKIHGYDFVPEFGERGEIFKHEKGYWWGKVYLIKKHLPECDYLLWIDADCIAINYNRGLESVIEQMERSLACMALTSETVLETGVMLFKNDTRTFELIQHWENYKDSLNTDEPNFYANNNHECLIRLHDNSRIAQQLILKLTNTQFTIKHINIEDRTGETLFMHVPGTTIDEKVRYMTEHAKQFDIRNDVYASFINLDHRKDRLQHMEAQLSRIGLKAERTRGLLPHEVKEPYDKIAVMQKRTPGAIGCHYSQVSIIETAYTLGKSALVMEDDLVFCHDFNQRLDYIQNFLNTVPDWDVFWLGATFHTKPAGWHRIENGRHTNSDLSFCQCTLNRDAETTHDPHIMRTYGIWSTYAYIVNYKSIPKILGLLDQNVYRSMGIDWLFIMLQPELKTYCFVPGCVKQIDNVSDIGLNNGRPAVTKFSGFAYLGQYWYQDRMTDFNPRTFDWGECKIV